MDKPSPKKSSTPMSNEMIPQHKRMAMGMPVNAGAKGPTSKTSY